MAIQQGKYPQLADRDWLVREYVTNEKSCEEIAEQVGCTAAAVGYRLKAHGIQARGRYSGKWKPKKCPRCEKEFTPKGPAQRYCSDECRPDPRLCEQCGKEFFPIQKGRATRRFCSHECRTAWNAEHCSYRYFNKATGYVTVVREPTMSRRVNGQGYTEVNIGADNKNGGRVLEHILVMEQQLGRRLFPHEEVHHKNGVKSDNDPGNLELWTTSQPRGQRVEDKIAWAVDFLQQYGYSVADPQ